MAEAPVREGRLLAGPGTRQNLV